MLKVFYLTAVLSAALMPLTANMALSSTPLRVSSYPVVPTSDIDKPACYIEASDGTTLNLNSICGKANQQTAVCPEITDPKQRAVYIEFYGNTPEALATLGCNPPPPPKYRPEDGSIPG